MNQSLFQSQPVVDMSGKTGKVVFNVGLLVQEELTSPGFRVEQMLNPILEPAMESVGEMDRETDADASNQ